MKEGVGLRKDGGNDRVVDWGQGGGEIRSDTKKWGLSKVYKSKEKECKGLGNG